MTTLPAGLAAPPRSQANGHKSACLHGHPYDEANTYVDPRGRRHCRTCRRERTARARAGSFDVTTPLATLVARAVVTHRDLADQLGAIADEIDELKTEYRDGLAMLFETREQLVADCLGEGMSRRAIADCLGVSHTTVLNIISGYGSQDEDDLDELGDE